MSKITYMQGNLFTSTAPAIGHGVNTSGVMGAGIAVAFKTAYPVMYEIYRAHCLAGELKPGMVYSWRQGPVQVYNIASQDKPGSHARLEWLREGLDKALAHADSLKYDRIALPRIGAGLGGLAWEDVERVMLEVVADYSCDIELWTL